MSVAIRTATRIQDQDDAPALGAGQDGYALTWDNASGAFVATALSAGVTDHGALTGLTPDDDHTQYALLAGRAGGQTLYGGTAANDDITIHGTSDGTRTTSYVLLQPSGGNVGIGTASPATLLHVTSTTATTGALRNVLTLATNVTSTGVGAAGLGGAILFQAESSTTVASDMAQIGALWTDATHATRTSKLTFATVNSAGSLNTDMTVSLGGVGIGTAPVAGTRIAASILANDASIANIYGSKNNVVANHPTGNLSFAYGMYNQATQQGAGGVSNLAALVNSVAISGNAPNTANGVAERGLAMAYCNASSVTVFKASDWGQATGGKTVTLARGLWIAAPTTTGTITTASGIYLEAITGAGTNYAIYSAGGQSYHAGNFGIGNTAPAEALDVTGNINTTGVVKVDDVQVLSNRVIDARCADVANSGDATTDGLIDALRDAMIAHGLIAAA